MFLGRITRTDGKYILQDAVSQATFLLDDQEKARQLDGQSVKVKGKLGTASKIIHVIQIQVV